MQQGIVFNNYSYSITNNITNNVVNNPYIKIENLLPAKSSKRKTRQNAKAMREKKRLEIFSIRLREKLFYD